MKKIVLIFTFMLLLPASAFAGRYSMGVDAWVVFWDSAIGSVISDNLDGFIQQELDAQVGVTIDSHTISTDGKAGKGLMMGPSLTWETNDRTWAVSVAGMCSAIISQKIDSSGSARSGMLYIPLTVTSDIQLTRMEIQTEGRYRFLKYFSAFAGYQYMYYNIDAKFKGGVAALYTTSTREATVTSNIHFPLAGVGVEYPVFSWLTLGLDIASGYMFADAEAEFDGSKGDIDIEPKMGMMAALKGVWKVSKTFEITFGYRFQYLSFDMTSDVDLDADTVTPDKTSKKETFHGIVFGGRYRF